jgi:hypothetical protein
MKYESVRTIQSKCYAGVQFTIARMTFGRRLELTRHVRDLAGRLEFHLAGDTAKDKLDGAAIGLEIDQLYLRWGLQEITGIQIDGADADAERLLEFGPEDLCREVICAIKRECGLSEEERKN